MPSNRIKDSVEIYRFRVTTKGTTKMYRGGEWQYDDDTEAVELIGLYTNKYKYEPWIPKRGSLKIEHQKLMPWFDVESSTAFVQWETIETKSYKDGERDD